MAKKSQKPAPPATAEKVPSTSNAGRVSSPASTGGAGTFFEQHVDAYWLAQLLVGGIPPILHDCTVVEVHLQTEHLGWHTDDFLIVGQNGSGDRRKLAGQVKRTFTISATDDECKKAMQDFWQDFKDARQFSLVSDRFALIILRGTDILLEHFSGLLDCARAARTGVDFEHRLATPGFVSTKAIRYCEEIRTIIRDAEGRTVSAAEVWPFLRVLHVLSLDLNSATRQTEAMIKTLLAHTTREQDASGAADASWNALLRVVGEGMPEARSFRRDDLPKMLRQRHSLLGGVEQRALRALNDHSTLILGGIRSTIGSELHLGRDRLVQQVIAQLESTQVVLISGAAGNGKSGVAKDVLGMLVSDHFVFSFRAEEFAHHHFDATLQSSQIPVNASTLGAILASQNRKVLLVESVERLLEKSTRDAFTDLLTLVARDTSWRLVLTCRDYSADLVRTCFLEAARVGHSVVTVPALDDEELKEVQAVHPTLAHPLANAALRRVLRNPYILDRALQIVWSAERPLPQSERELRLLFWQEIVRADHRGAGGMPRRRENVFMQIALRRAQALTLYANCGDLDPEIIDGLRRDSLIVSSQQSAVLAAPAHDVLEDWAILGWLEEQFAIYEGSLHDLSAAIGTYPAVRRTYRKWITELMERDPEGADRLFQAAIHEADLAAQFCDDTLISLLRSPSSPAFLERHSAELFTNDKRLLQRIIHLLRVACLTTPPWLATSAAHPSLFNIPAGLAWGCILRLANKYLGSFRQEDCLLLLGFIEDWARGVNWQNPYPEGAESVAALAHWLLPHFDNYRSDDQRKRTLQVLAKIPNVDRERFTGLLQGSRNNKKRDHTRENLREIIFEGFEGMPAARDMPEAVVSAATDYLLCSETDLRPQWGYGSPLESEPVFGIKRGRNRDFFPASAYRGPFLPLLRHHSEEGLAFLIEVFNHSADWYAHSRVRSEYIEPPFEMTLRFADGTLRTQWSNGRLWNLYRGTSVGPYALQSLLMALERWLLELAEARPRELDTVLLYILQQSDSAALTAVVASVATAFPHASGEALMVLLRSRECILLDRQRLASEVQAPSRSASLIPQLNARNKVYDEERKEADALPHRHHDLEAASANLQLGPLAPRVHEILNQHRAEMPPVEEQDDGDRVWRLAMHRMDLRQYTVVDDAAEAHIAPEDGRAPDEKRRFVRLDPNEPERDVKEMVEQSAAGLQVMNAEIGLLMWGMKVFAYEDASSYDPAQWAQRLQEARTIVESGGEQYNLGRGGPGYVAAICVRDHWEEMAGDEQEWCLSVIYTEVERDADRWAQYTRDQRFAMAADRPCARVLPLLLGQTLDDAQDARVRQALVVALTHAIHEVRWHVVWGIGGNLWVIDRELTLRCVNALATEATLVQQAADAALSHPNEEPRQLDALEAEVAAQIRRSFFEADAIADDAYHTMNPSTWFGARANAYILTILGKAPAEALAIAAFQRLANTLVEWWDADDAEDRDEHQGRPERNRDAEAALTELLEHFLLRTTVTVATTILQPILDAVERHPREVRWIVRGLIGVEDTQPNTPQFWSLWELFADKVRCAKWLPGIDNEHTTGGEMISVIFLGAWWKDEIRHWRSLEAHVWHIHRLFEDLPASSTVFDDYLRFLYHIGEQSLPKAFIRVAKRLQQGDPRQMLRNGDTIFMLEVCLQRYVYGRPLELKRHGDLRNAVLFLLDLLVENGSSAAFRMRDDFVTPVSIT
jgi:hypothetical protein